MGLTPERLGGGEGGGVVSKWGILGSKKKKSLISEYECYSCIYVQSVLAVYQWQNLSVIVTSILGTQKDKKTIECRSFTISAKIHTSGRVKNC